MDHYRTYLRAELGKLRDIGESRAMLSGASCPGALRDLASSPQGLADALGTQDRVDAYVESLSRDDLIEMTGGLSSLRENGVARQLAPNQAVAFIDVPVATILLCQAEVALRPAFERNGWRLEAVARDPEVLRAPEYRHHQPDDAVQFPICLAKPDPSEPDVFRVIDGMHRAIQMVRNGQARISLCVIGKPSAGG